MALTPEERKAHIDLMVKTALWSGWVLALAALLLGGHTLTRFHRRLVDLQTENDRLKTEIQTLKNGRSQ
jgi:hypothetical protein